MSNKTYSEKLKDPRWQKKRLQILNRDEFTCQKCYDDESTLHVHHLHYFKGREPWEINSDFLITLCENCHNSEHEYFQAMELLTLKLKKSKALTEDILRLGDALSAYNFLFPAAIDIIEFSLNNPAEKEKAYLKYLKEKNKPNNTEPFEGF